MIVYRLENGKGEGIYQSQAAAEIEEDESLPQTNLGGDPRHPSPLADSLLRANGWDFQEYLFFAFESLASFRAWFFNDEFLARAAERGFHIVKYETDEVILGNSQCAFDRAKSRVVD